MKNEKLGRAYDSDQLVLGGAAGNRTRPLYQALCRLNCRFVPFRSGSVPLITCGFVLGA